MTPYKPACPPITCERCREAEAIISRVIPGTIDHGKAKERGVIRISPVEWIELCGTCDITWREERTADRDRRHLRRAQVRAGLPVEDRDPRTLFPEGCNGAFWNREFALCMDRAHDFSEQAVRWQDSSMRASWIFCWRTQISRARQARLAAKEPRYANSPHHYFLPPMARWTRPDAMFLQRSVVREREREAVAS